MAANIPIDRIPPPWEGRLLASLSLGPDIPWQSEVQWAEQTAADYEAGLLEPVPSPPLSHYYDGLGINLEMGWCVDA